MGRRIRQARGAKLGMAVMTAALQADVGQHYVYLVHVLGRRLCNGDRLRAGFHSVIRLGGQADVGQHGIYLVHALRRRLPPGFSLAGRRFCRGGSPDSAAYGLAT